MCSAELTCVNGSMIQFLLRKLLFRIDLWLFLLKIFKKLSYLSVIQGSKLTLANSQNASDFDNLRVSKISTSKRLPVRIILVSQTKGKNLLVVSPVC